MRRDSLCFKVYFPVPYAARDMTQKSSHNSARKTFKTNADILLACESGGSKTRLRLLNTEGGVIAESSCPGVAAVRPGILPVRQCLTKGIRELCSSCAASEKSISHCYFSLGGPNVAEVEQVLRAVLPRALVKIGREADGDLIMVCAPYLGCSVAVLAGTGTVAVGESGGRRVYAGGWGPDLDDAGSGGRIGREALSAVLLAIDGRAPKTSLSSIFGKFIKRGVVKSFDARMELKKRVTALSRKQLAESAPEVYRHFLIGDKTAARIIQDAAGSIALLANAVAAKNNSGSEIRVMALGGVFKFGLKFRNLCAEKLGEIRNDVKFVFPSDFDLAKGACIMVLKQAGVRINAGIMNAISKDF